MYDHEDRDDAGDEDVVVDEEGKEDSVRCQDPGMGRV